MPVGFSFDSPPLESIAYLREKRPELHFDYDEIMHEAHHKAFTVAKVTRLDLLTDIQESLVTAQQKGQSFKAWKANIKGTLKDKGWWGETTVTNPKTGEVKDIFVGSRRLKTIYDTNMRTSYARGRYSSQMQSEGEYLRYSAVLDQLTRPAHSVMHGIVLPKDHTWWDQNYPPNGWHCRCKAQVLTKYDLKRRGLKVYDGTLKKIADRDWAYHPGKVDTLNKTYLDKINRLKSDCKEMNAKKKRPCMERLYEVAKEESIVDAKKFQKWFKMPKESYPITNIPPKIRSVLNTESSQALLSVETLIKNKDHHPDILWYEYLLLNSIVEKSTVAVRDGDATMVVVKSFYDESIYYYAALKVTADKEEVYVTSFRRTKKDDMEKKIKRGEILWDKR